MLLLVVFWQGIELVLQTIFPAVLGHLSPLPLHIHNKLLNQHVHCSSLYIHYNYYVTKYGKIIVMTHSSIIIIISMYQCGLPKHQLLLLFSFNSSISKKQMRYIFI